MFGYHALHRRLSTSLHGGLYVAFLPSRAPNVPTIRAVMVDEFISVLTAATRLIPEIYFYLPVAGHEDPIYRERVYCYELYHQMRLLLDADERFRPFALGGEIDKQGHKFIAACSPDFVFHEPGVMESNVCVVEVKPANGAMEGIQKDLQTLLEFVGDKINYQMGIYLVYGGTEADVVRFVKQFKNVESPKLRLYWHRKPSEAAVRIQ